MVNCINVNGEWHVGATCESGVCVSGVWEG